MRLDQRLVDAAIAQATARYPSGSGGASAMYTSDGGILTSVSFDAPNVLASLCHETGALCEAHRLGLKVTASVCVSRDGPADPFIILSPCGICQERLATWGLDIEIAVPAPGDMARWQVKLLRDVQPFYWRSGLEN